MRAQHTRCSDWLEAILLSSLDAIVAIDHAGRIIEFNPAAEQMFGYCRSDVLGKSMADLLVPERFRQQHKAGLSRYLETGEGAAVGRRVEVSALRANGEEFPVELAILPVHPEDSPFFTAYLRDLSKQKQMELERRQHQDAMRRFLIQTIQSVSMTIEMRDPYTAGHQRRVAHLSRAIAEELGFDEERAEGVYLGGLIHDIGKIAVPGEILARTSTLDEVSMAMIRQHCDVGANIVKGVDFPWPVSDMILQHHERLDGSGYPHGLRDGDIILEAKIIAVADVVEAMSSHRPYRPGLGLDVALGEVSDKAGSGFDEQVVTACHTLFKDREYQFEQQAGMHWEGFWR